MGACKNGLKAWLDRGMILTAPITWQVTRAAPGPGAFRAGKPLRVGWGP